MQDARICPRCRRMNPVDADVCTDCGLDLRGTRVTHLADDTPPEPVRVEGLACPACGVPMKTGEAGVEYNHRRLWTWAFTWSWLELFFREPGQKREWLMGPHVPAPAARCSQCGGLWLVPPSR